MARAFTNARYILAKHLSWEHVGQRITISDGNQRLYAELISVYISPTRISANLQFDTYTKTIELAPHRLVGIGLEE